MRPKKAEKGVLVGGIIPRPSLDRLDLYVTSKNLSKSKFIYNMITEFLKKIPSDEDMVGVIANSIYKTWEEKEDKGGWNGFAGEIRRDLSKRIAPIYVDSVMEKLNAMNKAKGGGMVRAKKGR